MAAINTLILALPLLLSLTIFISLTSATTITPYTNSTELRINLIHRDSILSPYYNPNTTLEERAQHAIDQTTARGAYLQDLTGTTLLSDDDGKRAPLVPNNQGSLFLAKIAIGQPPVPQLVMVDTSSDMLWVQCQPCFKCAAQSTPVFNPSRSTTYLNVPCTARNGCGGFPRTVCDSKGEYCLYVNKIFDGTSTKGNVAQEQLVLKTSGGGQVTVPIYFGCGHANAGPSLDGQISGVLGLGGHSRLAGLQGNRFSYCLGDMHDPYYSFNHLIIGSGAKFIGYSAAFEVYNGLYYLNLDQISVGEKLLDNIDTQVFKRTPSGYNGVVIDTATPFLWLNKAAYIPYRDEIRRLLRRRFTEVQDPTNPSILCFRGSMQEDLNGFPEVTFHFGMSEFSIDYRSIFFPLAREAFCLAALQSGPNGLSVIGLLAQQFFNIGYDLSTKEIHFYREDCSLY